MNKLANLILKGEISVEELANAHELIDRAKLVKEGLEACKKTLLFPFGVNSLRCYSSEFMGTWADCTKEGIITFSSDDGVLGEIDLKNPKDVFIAFENEDLCDELIDFLELQIDRSKNA